MKSRAVRASSGGRKNTGAKVRVRAGDTQWSRVKRHKRRRTERSTWGDAAIKRFNAALDSIVRNADAGRIDVTSLANVSAAARNKLGSCWTASLNGAGLRLRSK